LKELANPRKKKKNH